MHKAFTDYNQVLAQLQKDDLNAFEALYKETRVLLYGVAYELIQDEPASRDLVQDFFIDFWNQKMYRKVNVSLKNFLITCISNRAFNFLDKRNTENRLKSRQVFPSEIQPVYITEQTQLKEMIENALEKVPEGAARIFILHYMDGLSHLQIAEHLQISPYTVRNQISKALKTLRTLLKKSETP